MCVCNVDGRRTSELQTIWETEVWVPDSNPNVAETCVAQMVCHSDVCRLQLLQFLNDIFSNFIGTYLLFAAQVCRHLRSWEWWVISSDTGSSSGAYVVRPTKTWLCGITLQLIRRISRSLNVSD